MNNMDDQSQILECSFFLIIFVIFSYGNRIKTECTELECKILEIKEMIRELDEDD